MVHIIHYTNNIQHYYDVITGAMASQITSLMIVYSTVYSSADQRKHQSSASLAFVRGIHRRPVNSLHKGPVTRKIFPFDDVIMKHHYYPALLLIIAQHILLMSYFCLIVHCCRAVHFCKFVILLSTVKSWRIFLYKMFENQIKDLFSLFMPVQWTKCQFYVKIWSVLDICVTRPVML